MKAAGYCTASWHHAQSGAPKKKIRFYATYGVIRHPIHGIVLFDTGYTSRFFESTRKYPYKLYRAFTPVFLESEEEAHRQLRAEGIDPLQIKHIIVSHFHADHIGGLRDFPNARFLCTKKSFESVGNKKGIAAVRRGFLPQQMPEDFSERAEFINIDQSKIADPILGKLVDVFGDGSILLCALDGHAKGQIGALLNTPDGKIFLISDAAWLKPAYQHLLLPHPIVRLFFDSWRDYKASLTRLHKYHLSHPNTLIVPCHCYETFAGINSGNLYDAI